MTPEEERFLQDKVKGSQSDTELTKELNKRAVTVTMVGALNAVEEKLGYLWQGNSDLERKYYDIYMSIRNKILSIGNDQIRNFEKKVEENGL